MRHDPDTAPSSDDDAPIPDDPALAAVLDRWASRGGEPVDVEAALARVTRRRLAESTDAAPAMDELRARRQRGRVAAPRRGRVLAWGAIAAGLVLAIGTALVQRGGGAGAPALRYATARAQLDTIALADSTIIVLGPSSTLAVDADYGDAARTLRLEGEATFTVTHDAARPFTVRTAQGDVVDVGTVFAVRASAESLLTVRVTEGEVELRPAATRSTAARLRAGDAAVLEGARLVVRRREVMPADVNALAQGRLAFREASLGEVRDALRRWYGITLVIDDPALLDRHVTADFTAEPVRRVVTVLALALAADATWRGDTAVLRRSAAPPGR